MGMKEDFEGKGEMLLMLLGAVDEKLDEEKGKISNQVKSRMTKKEEEPECLSKTEKGDDDIPDSQDIVVNATSLDSLEESAFIEVVRTSFDRFDMSEAGVVTTEADVIGICLSVVCKMGWATCTTTIDHKVTDLVYTLTDGRDGDFTMPFPEFLEWFKSEIAPHGFLSIDEAQVKCYDIDLSAMD